MSSREPLWFCHECHAEMRPLMMPDPHCASCNSTFVEKMENPENDPREYQQDMPGGFGGDYPSNMDNFLLGLHHLLDHSSVLPGSGPNRSLPGASGRGTRLEFTGGPNGGTHVISFGGPNALLRSNNNTSGEVPTMSQFLRRGPEMHGTANHTGIPAPLMAQYLLAMLGAQRPGGMRGFGSDPFPEIIFGGLGIHEGEGRNGRWGDYVYNQEALDHIITQLMENSNSGRPVPATDEIIEDLPREVLEVGSSRLQQDCAVCKDQFKLGSDDPDEQVVITLPCTHPFHEGCILPWIKSSGTCPVCRYALVPQPGHHSPGQGPAGASGSPPNGSAGGPAPRSPGARSGEPGFYNTIFGSMGSSQSDSAPNGGPRTTAANRSRSYPDPRRRRHRSGSTQHFPGAWREHVD